MHEGGQRRFRCPPAFCDDRHGNEPTFEPHASGQQLRELDRQTLEAFYLRDRSLKHMSREYETPVGDINPCLHVTRQRLKDVLEGNSAVDFQEPSKDGTKEMRKRDLMAV